jgi:DNA-binding transcriptional LysR family regulator
MTLDWNLLPALDVLLAEQSVTVAAERLHLSAPAMSRTLSRIREAVGDPILVRAGRKLVPTPRALALRDEVRAVVARGERLLAPPAPVDLAQLERTLTIRTNDTIVGALGRELMRRAARELPRVLVRFVAEGEEDATALRDGEVDLDIGVQGELGPEIRVQTLYHEHIACVFRARGPIAKSARGRMTLARFAAAPHIVVSRRGRARSIIDEQLAARGVTRRVAAVVPTYLLALWLASQTDYLALVPRRVAQAAAARFGLRMAPLPVAQTSFVIAQAWHPRFDDDPAHLWLRNTLRAIASARPTRGG